mgnify:FL=1
MTVIRSLAAVGAVFTASCAQAQDGRATAAPESACALAKQRFETFIAHTPPGDVRNALSAEWLSLPQDRDALAGLLAQSGRERGPDAPFAMGYRPDFARSVEALTDADIDRVHVNLTRLGAITCAGVDTTDEPFTEDLAGFNAWAEGQMMNPDPGAPEGAQSLALSRPVIFDGGGRALVAESYSYTPIPLSRPPSAMVTLNVYRRDGAAWVREASIVVARSG